MEGTVSQIIYLGFSYYFMKSRIIYKILKIYPFFSDKI